MLKVNWLRLLYTKNRPDTNGQLNCEIGGLDCHVITTEYRTRVHCIHMKHLFCNALVHVIYSGVSGQCSHTITAFQKKEGHQLTNV